MVRNELLWIQHPGQVPAGLLPQHPLHHLNLPPQVSLPDGGGQRPGPVKQQPAPVPPGVGAERESRSRRVPTQESQKTQTAFPISELQSLLR